MITRFSRYIAAPLALLTLAGCGVFSEPEIKKPIKETYVQDNCYGGVLSADFGDRTHGIPRQLYIYDIDKDGQADVIQYGDLVYWVAEGFAPKGIVREDTTHTMTPEIRAAATRELQAEKDLAFLIHQENYRLQQEKKSK